MLNTRNIVNASMIGCILYLLYISFSNILYLELVTFGLLVFSRLVVKKELIYGSVVFGLLIILLKGFFVWNVMYIVVIFAYSCLFTTLEIKDKYIPLFGGFCSFMIGIFLDLPFMIFGEYACIAYALSSFKVSIIQGVLTGLILFFAYEKIIHLLRKAVK